MRAAAFALLLAGCLRPSPDAGPPPSYPTLEPDRPVDPNPMDLADLKSIAGAARIILEIGPGPILRTHSCDADDAGANAGADAASAHGAARCYQCTLAVFDPEPAPGAAAHPLEASLRTLATTLLAYPHSFLRAARIEKIALCRKLVDAAQDTAQDPAKSAAKDAASAPTSAPAPEHIAGLAEGAARRLMVNLDHRDLAHADATLHHEIFHLFDQATAPGGDHQRDPAWERINPRGFRYGDPASASIEAGFVNDYARTNAAEDKASVFEYVMGFPDELCARGADDPRLLEKARLLLDRIDAALPPGLGEFARRKAACLAQH